MILADVLQMLARRHQGLCGNSSQIACMPCILQELVLSCLHHCSVRKPLAQDLLPCMACRACYAHRAPRCHEAVSDRCWHGPAMREDAPMGPLGSE